MDSGNKLFLLDAYALIYRAYYAFIKNPRINSKGFNTSAILGFVKHPRRSTEKRELFVRHLPPLKDVLCIAVRIFLLNFLVMHL